MLHPSVACLPPPFLPPSVGPHALTLQAAQACFQKFPNGGEAGSHMPTAAVTWRCSKKYHCFNFWWSPSWEGHCFIQSHQSVSWHWVPQVPQILTPLSLPFTVCNEHLPHTNPWDRGRQDMIPVLKRLSDSRLPFQVLLASSFVAIDSVLWDLP